jgi:uncharacterized protein YjbI with pentapeptide repeats
MSEAIMANSQHLAKLKEGVKVWNNWRREYQDITPDLRESNLVGAKLCEIDFHEANLRGADLRGADLSGANLCETDLRGANLRLSYLSRTNLQESNLRGADLRGADLESAKLRDANLRGATVRWVTLRGAKNLAVQQLCKALTLYEAELDQDHQELILRDHPHLLEDPDKNI